MSTITQAPAADQPQGKRRPLDRGQRAYLYAAARQQQIGLVLLAIECAVENAIPRTATNAPTTPTPPPERRRRQPATCPSQGRYRRHRDAGEDCADCTTFMRAKWRERSKQRQRDITPKPAAPKPDIADRLARRRQTRAERVRTRRAAVARYREQREAEVAGMKHTVMAQFVEDAA